MKYTVYFTVQFKTEVECEPENLKDQVCNVNIPEDDQTTYVSDTFEVDLIEDEDGKEIET